MRGRWVAAAVGLLLLPLLAGCPKERGETPGRGDKGKPAADPVPTPAAAPKDWPVGGRTFYGMKITVWVEEGYTPFYVTVAATDTTTGEHVNVISTQDELGLKVHQQYWTVPIAYPGGDVVQVTVHVKAAKPGQSRGYITIREGGPRLYTRSAEFNGTAAAALDYTTQRH
jgi:hypothetical protein